MNDERMRTSILVLMCCLSLGCWGREKTIPKAEEVVVRWIECEECTDKELRSVVSLGSRAIPSLEKFLMTGPPLVAEQAHKQHLLQAYLKMKTYITSHPEEKLRLSKKEYVGTYIDNYDLKYRTQSAQALGALGGPESRRILLHALSNKHVKPGLSIVIGHALDAMK